MKTLRTNKKGFTILELMVASSVFSLMLLVVLGSVIYLGKLYYKGVTVSNTVEVNRSAIEEVTQAIQFSSDGFVQTTSASGWNAYCISGNKYSYKTGVQLREDTTGSGLSNEVFVVSADPACTALSSPVPISSAERKELLKENMRLTTFSMSATSGNLVNIEIGVAFGGDPSIAGDDDDVFNIDGATGSILSCKGSSSGSAFCATSFLQTSATGRVN